MGRWCRRGDERGAGRRVGAAVDLDGDAAVAVADDLAGGVEEAALEGVGGDVGVVAGQAEPEGGGEGLGQDA
jgi:hypothetical protein